MGAVIIKETDREAEIKTLTAELADRHKQLSKAQGRRKIMIQQQIAQIVCDIRRNTAILKEKTRV